MSIIYEDHSWCYIEEQSFLNDTYKNISNYSFYEKYVCKASMFDIAQQFVYDSQHLKNLTSDSTTKKRKRRHSEALSEVELLLQSKLKEAINLVRCDHKLKASDTKDNNGDARSLQNLVNELQNVFDAIRDSESDQEDIDDIKWHNQLDLKRVSLCLVSNPHEFGLLKEIASERFLMPPKSTFLMSDITRMEALLDADVLFDCIVMDPPWQNKSVKRKRVYNSMSMFDLKMLPIKNLCAKNCLVAVWVTNKTKLQDYIINELFPMWHVSLHTVWYWIKVTNTLTPVLPLNSPGKKPYEKLVLGFYHGGSIHNKGSSNIPLDMTLISVPSSIHSHKPPLANVLNKYLPADAKRLELFARNLQPGWFSWGNEVLLLQNEKLFNKCGSTTSSVGGDS